VFKPTTTALLSSLLRCPGRASGAASRRRHRGAFESSTLAGQLCNQPALMLSLLHCAGGAAGAASRRCCWGARNCGGLQPAARRAAQPQEEGARVQSARSLARCSLARSSTCLHCTPGRVHGCAGVPVGAASNDDFVQLGVLDVFSSSSSSSRFGTMQAKQLMYASALPVLLLQAAHDSAPAGQC
jgi:hypothetical protein